MVSLLKKFFEHFRNGTLIWRWKNHSQIEQEKKWIQFVNSDKKYFDLKTDFFLIRLYKNDLISKAIYFNDFESKEIKFLQNYIRKGDVFFDVGGNIGLFTLLAANKVTTSGKVYSFEPAKANFEKLKENIALNNFGNIDVYPIGVSDRKEVKYLYNFKEGLGALSSYAQMENEEYTTEITETTSLWEFTTENNVDDIDIIKIDVEGWELPVLIGARKLLEKEDAPLLIVEFTDSNSRSAGFTCQEVYDQLLMYGYSIYSVQNDLTMIPEQKKEFYSYTNLIAIKFGSKAYARAEHLIK